MLGELRRGRLNRRRAERDSGVDDLLAVDVGHPDGERARAQAVRREEVVVLLPRQRLPGPVDADLERDHWVAVVTRLDGQPVGGRPFLDPVLQVTDVRRADQLPGNRDSPGHRVGDRGERLRAEVDVTRLALGAAVDDFHHDGAAGAGGADVAAAHPRVFVVGLVESRIRVGCVQTGALVEAVPRAGAQCVEGAVAGVGDSRHDPAGSHRCRPLPR